MKVVTFNINNVNKRLANLLAWLNATKPDVVCLQELKAETRGHGLSLPMAKSARLERRGSSFQAGSAGGTSQNADNPADAGLCLAMSNTGGPVPTLEMLAAFELSI